MHSSGILSGDSNQIATLVAIIILANTLSVLLIVSIVHLCKKVASLCIWVVILVLLFTTIPILIYIAFVNRHLYMDLSILSNVFEIGPIIHIQMQRLNLENLASWSNSTFGNSTRDVVDRITGTIHSFLNPH